MTEVTPYTKEIQTRAAPGRKNRGKGTESLSSTAVPCAVRVEGVCTGRAQHRHHRKLRSRGGSNDPANLLDVCLRCHDYIHRHPKESIRRGWMLPSWADETPLQEAS
jgi:hypothetical protein